MKIKYALLEKLLKLTNKEVDFLLYVGRYQDDYGRVTGLYYRDVCSGADMCKQTFYDTLRSLEEKSVIIYNHSDLTSDFDLTILDNDFSYPSACKEGYINLNRKVFNSQSFKKLKAKEKLLLLLFLGITHENSSSYQIGTVKFYKKYMALLDVTKRVLRGYLHSLKKFFSIGVKDGKYYITYLASIFNPRRPETEEAQKQYHLVKVNCRRNKVKNAEPREIKETATLINQYRRFAVERDQNIIDLLCSCIYRSAAGKKDVSLSSKTVHWHLRAALGLPN